MPNNGFFVAFFLEGFQFSVIQWDPIFWGRSNLMQMYGDFPYSSALFGLVSISDHCFLVLGYPPENEEHIPPDVFKPENHGLKSTCWEGGDMLVSKEST